MSFFKPVENASLITNEVAALKDYVPNSIIYVMQVSKNKFAK
jgi:hypothetical protein